MSEFKGTPGPYQTVPANKHHDCIRIFAGSVYIGSVGNSDFSREKNEANATLMAAAPELLEALIELSRYFAREYVMDKRSDKEIYSAKESAENKARAAIAKALGQ